MSTADMFSILSEPGHRNSNRNWELHNCGDDQKKKSFHFSLSLFSKSIMTLKKLKIDETKVCVSLASDFLETINVIIITLGTVTVSNMRMHHMLIIHNYIYNKVKVNTIDT